MIELETLHLTPQEEERLRKIEEKRSTGVFEIAFCGHFSAGKSTLLNALVGAEVLPTSPIPTSANVIKITKGEFGLKVLGPESRVLHSFTGELPWREIKEWGKEGEIREIHISAPISFLSSNGVIADTPGVDSTDPTHAKVTAEQLYSTDAIVYVMDYNHVQSETNLHFLKQLSESGKPIFIVINQVDKHDENEMSVNDFRSRIDEVFEEWHIRYVQFFFTTMKELEHPLNEFAAFKNKIKAILQESPAFTDPAQQALKKGFYEALTERLQSDVEEKRQEVLQRAEDAGFASSEVEEVSSVNEKLKQAEMYEELLEEAYEQEMKRLYDNVHLFPSTTTELVERFVHSKQKQFKVGVLFSGRKTKEEQQKRLRQLTVEVNDNLKSQLIYYVEDYFRRVPVQELANKEDFLKAMQELDMHVTEEWIDSWVTSKSTNREYIYTLTRQMNDQIVRDVKRKGGELLYLYIKGIKPRKEAEISGLTEKKQQLQELEAYHEELLSIQNKAQLLLKEAERYKPRAGSVKPLEDLLSDIQSSGEAEEESFWQNIDIAEAEEENLNEEETVAESKVILKEEAVAPWLQQLSSWKEDFKNHTLFREEGASLQQTIESYNKSSFTISLFGAFSAGKSSFANALLGADIMPVSPHPTTATVNTVRRPDEEYGHMEAVVHFKDRTRLSEEIRSVGRSLRQDLDIDSLPKWNYRDLTKLTKQQKSSVDYLKILQKSLREKQQVVGTSERTEIGKLAPYIADEETACLVDEVTMYYDCGLTREGIILVDTPGVNSIHGRHTNVAFKQLEASDAIFYLTYYNHAFSKADQYFLQQVSSVNESFTNDKLYFVINASDLAETDQELKQVRRHVSTQLKENGFTNPRLYHVSSKLALNPESGDDSFSAFSVHFYDTVLAELKQLGLQLIESEAARLYHRLKHFENYMTQESEDRKTLLNKEKQIIEEEIKEVSSQSFQYVERDALRELEQLSLYLRKRMSYVLHDYYQNSVNVSVLTAENRKALQQQLEQALTDWSATGEQFLRQEWEAVSIRLDHAIQRLFRSWCDTYEQDLQKRVSGFHFPRPSFQTGIRTPLEPVSLLENIERYKSFLKSKKEFFEQDKSKELKDTVVQDAMERVTDVLQKKEYETQEVLHEAVKEITETTRGEVVQALTREQEKYELLMDAEQLSFIQSKKNAFELLPPSPLKQD
ncbi:dynamin family protein [Alkalicoccus saliphilus]|uniref:Dynamin N-terminal domain-containing protein n=1 Tax=Alkalicoccus saliphilus TaxID=200989 RepID=A0A2T4U806_9BACI|nr:dynamin family protein [Alkalicoccus saliphilus]PTL39529.1 hypothetical protein C6Y45_05670 [Alkalicoccus saliphilus]